MADKNFKLVLLLVLFLQVDFATASRPLYIHPPAIRSVPLMKPKPPAIYWHPIPRYKLTDEDAFRPTSPGHSPGVGHYNPPTIP
ncbi:hypothetical protein K2173_009368 [Erythroxylum novogranatense]|uniref:Uncharacterized protein n=1 Tax=Erythroxylum novogranatense TaxID=1862640 RepID=A0AAV8U3R7_9ROSI|nr:hypothetical protein K2173_009368 [Erythroxylum novogranatense]